MGQGAISKEDLTPAPDLCDSGQNIAVYNKQIPTERRARESGMDLEFHLDELGIDKNMKLRSLIPGLCRLIC